MRQFSKIALWAAAGAILAAPGALAGDMSGYFGNTIVCTYPDGAVTKVYVKDGGTFTVIRGGKTVNGTWVDTGKEACYTETDPPAPAGTKPICTSSAPMKVGGTWSVTDPGGKTSQCELKAGNQ